MQSFPLDETVPTIRIRPPSPTVSFATVPRPSTTVFRPSTVPEHTVLRSALRQGPTMGRSASVTIVEGDVCRVISTRRSSDRATLDQLQTLLNVDSDATVLSRIRSLSALEQEYCSQLVKTHEKQKALHRALTDARKEAAQQRLQWRIDSKDREMDALQRRAARLDTFNRDILARVAIRTAAHSDAEKRILRSRIDQQNRQIRDLERQLREARANGTRRGRSLCNR